MTDDAPRQPERTLAGYQSRISEPGEYKNPNVDKQPLNDETEYVFALKELPRVKTFKQEKRRNDGTTFFEDVDKAICVFTEEQTKNEATAFFRVDKLNFSDDDTFSSSVVRFFTKLKQPLNEFKAPNWSEKFIVGMRFRSRVVVGKGQDKKPNQRYYIDVNTVRRLQPGDAGASDAYLNQQLPPQSTETGAGSPTLANALFIAKGAKSWEEAAKKLKEANAPKEVTLALFQANYEGTVKFPI